MVEGSGVGGWEVGSYAVSGKSKEGLVADSLNILWLHLLQMQTAALAVSLSTGFAKKRTHVFLFFFPSFLRQDGTLHDN